MEAISQPEEMDEIRRTHSDSLTYRSYDTNSEYSPQEGPSTQSQPQSQPHVPETSSDTPQETSQETMPVLQAFCEKCGTPEGPWLCKSCWPVPPNTQPPPLTSFDVGALILNKMIGSGIFTAPPLVLLYTGSGGVAISLWIGGFLYTLLSMFIYLQFARELPHTGGELIYLDEMFRRPKLLVYTLYALFFVLVWNDATNSMQFAIHVFISATWTGEACPETIDPRFLRFLAVVLVTFVCLLHYFSARIGRVTNKALAICKFVMVLALFSLGCRAVQQSNNRGANFSHIDTNITVTSRCTNETISHAPVSGARQISNGAAAFLLVLFSFQGWENATFVSDEIATYGVLRKGFIGAVLVVGTLYIMVNAVFLTAIPYLDVYTYVLEGGSNIGPWFGHNSVNANKIWAVLLSISTAGNLVSVIYTEARVKQAIAKAGLIPWSSYWAQGEFRPETPKGGLILHWISSVVFIIISSKISNISEAIGFPGLLSTYGQGFIGVLIGWGFLKLAGRVRNHELQPPQQPSWAGGAGSTFSNSPITRIVASALYVLVNAYIVLFIAIPPYKNADGTTRSVKGWLYAAAMGGITLVTFIYYILVIPTKWNKERSIIEITGAKASIKENEDGHHATYGYRQYLDIKFPEDDFVVRTQIPIKSFWYWFFGGQNNAHYPKNRWSDWTERLVGQFRRASETNVPAGPGYQI